MENIIGKAKSYLEEHGIDTSNMTIEEIIAKYNELISAENNEDAREEVVEAKEDAVEDAVEEDAIDKFLADNQEIIDTLNEEQKAMLDRLVELAKNE